jgi:2-oxoglutarate ferredoxin oxidoreductase subunit alpha
VLALRLLAPLRREALEAALAGVRRLWVVEQNHSGQLYHYLQSAGVLRACSRSVARPGPLPLRPGEIVDVILDDAGTGEET